MTNHKRGFLCSALLSLCAALNCPAQYTLYWIDWPWPPGLDCSDTITVVRDPHQAPVGDFLLHQVARQHRHPEACEAAPVFVGEMAK